MAEKKTGELFGEKALFVPYVDPGYILYREIASHLKEYRIKFGEDPELIFLQNHGVFVGGGSIDRIKELYEYVFSKINCNIEKVLSVQDMEIPGDLDLIKNLIQNVIGPRMVLKCRVNSLISHFIREYRNIEKINKPFIPDGIVYCRAFPLEIRREDNISEESIKYMLDGYRKEHSCDPRIVIIKGLGIIGMEENDKALDLVLDMFEDAMKISYYSNNFGGQHFMEPEQIQFIEDWEVEKYRRQLSTKA
jgi:rhamnose utilization protein RhaD (predicted bifunctional aldolase and dehydrogenase)